VEEKVKYDVTEFHDGIAGSYDDMLDSSISARAIRDYFQNAIFTTIKPGEHLVEIGCGTGTDAIALAEMGIRVTATDISPKMIEETRAKVNAKSLAELIKTELLDADKLASLNRNVFDGLISNLNAVNYLKDINSFSENAFAILKPGGKVFLVMLNKVCVWEVMYYFFKFRPITAFKRLIKREKDFKTEMILYFPCRAWKIFSKHFQVNKTRGFGYLYPPDGLSAFHKRHLKFFSKLQGLENFFCSTFPFYCLCDHFFIEMTRK